MAFARSPTTRGSVLHRELLLAQVAELFTSAEIRRCPLSTLRMADVQISSSLSPPLAELNEMVQYIVNIG